MPAQGALRSAAFGARLGRRSCLKTMEIPFGAKQGSFAAFAAG